MAEAVVRLRVDASGATRALNGVQQKTNQLQNSFNGLRNIIAATGIAVVGTQAVKTAANFEKLNVRLGLLTKASGTFARSQEIASDAQKAFGLSATEALEGITDITARLAPLNVGVEDIKSTFFGFNTAAKLAGASTIEASNAFRQLAQALGSGRLQGDEFRSISEQIPTLLAPVADELDTTVGELKKFASQGKITSEVVLRALRKIEKDGGASLKELIANDPTQVFKNLSNETENLSRAFGESLMPVVIPVVKALTEITEAATDFVNSPIGQTALIFAGIALAAKGAAVALIAAKAGFVAAGGAAVIFGAAMNAIPFVALATGIGAVTTAIIKKRKEQKKLNDVIKEGTKEEVNNALTTLEARLEVLQSLKRGSAFRFKQIENIKTSITLLNERLAALKQVDDATEDIEEKTNKISEAFKKIGDDIGKGVSDALHDAILQTKALGDAARSILRGIASDLLRLGINTLLKSTGFGIFSNLAGFANGGRPPVGRPSIVGEKGPEIFVPSTAGTIIPNDKIGGSSTNIVVNVDATNTEVNGDDGTANELGRLIAVAVQSEILEQKRAGGLLA